MKPQSKHFFTSWFRLSLNQNWPPPPPFLWSLLRIAAWTRPVTNRIGNFDTNSQNDVGCYIKEANDEMKRKSKVTENTSLGKYAQRHHTCGLSSRKVPSHQISWSPSHPCGSSLSARSHVHRFRCHVELIFWSIEIRRCLKNFVVPISWEGLWKVD